MSEPKMMTFQHRDPLEIRRLYIAGTVECYGPCVACGGERTAKTSAGREITCNVCNGDEFGVLHEVPAVRIAEILTVRYKAHAFSGRQELRYEVEVYDWHGKSYPKIVEEDIFPTKEAAQEEVNRRIRGAHPVDACVIPECVWCQWYKDPLPPEPDDA